MREIHGTQRTYARRASRVRRRAVSIHGTYLTVTVRTTR